METSVLIREIDARIKEAKRTPRAIEVFAAAARPGCRLIVDSETGHTQAWPHHCPIPPGYYPMGASIKERVPCAA